MSHKHLTPKERESILFFLAQNCTITEIADMLGRNKSTISREVKRNSIDNRYSPHEAQKLYKNRRKRCAPKIKLMDSQLASAVAERLKLSWSPEQIVGRDKLNVSVPTIYRAFKSGLLSQKIKIHLRRKGKPYRQRGVQERRGRLTECLSIEQRPVEVLERGRVGDWELDTVLGKQGTGGMVTSVDRKSRFLLAGKIKTKAAEEVTAVLNSTLAGKPVHTLTTDNGKEFAGHKTVSATLGVPMYFAHPHSPWERGTNENTNGLLREFLPKGLDFRKVSDEDILRAVDLINNRPRKCLCFKTPAEVFYDFCNFPLHLA